MAATAHRSKGQACSLRFGRTLAWQVSLPQPIPCFGGWHSLKLFPTGSLGTVTCVLESKCLTMWMWPTPALWPKDGLWNFLGYIVVFIFFLLYFSPLICFSALRWRRKCNQLSVNFQSCSFVTRLFVFYLDNMINVASTYVVYIYNFMKYL